MKAVALITEDINTDAAQWQFDKVMSAIAYDVELIVVFMPTSIDQLIHTKAWNSLILYGVNAIYTFNTQELSDIKTPIPSQKIGAEQLSLFIHQADIIL